MTQTAGITPEQLSVARKLATLDYSTDRARRYVLGLTRQARMGISPKTLRELDARNLRQLALNAWSKL